MTKKTFKTSSKFKPIPKVRKATVTIVMRSGKTGVSTNIVFDAKMNDKADIIEIDGKPLPVTFTVGKKK